MNRILDHRHDKTIYFDKLVFFFNFKNFEEIYKLTVEKNIL